MGVFFISLKVYFIDHFLILNMCNLSVGPYSYCGEREITLIKKRGPVSFGCKQVLCFKGRASGRKAEKAGLNGI